jgi:hypothetical protein
MAAVQMIGVLYYGRTCAHSQELLRLIAKQGISDKLRFVPVDQREQRGDQTLAILDNGSRVLIPPSVTAVPALLDIRDKQVYMGPEVGQRLAAEAERAARAATGAEREPMAFSDLTGSGGPDFSFIGDDPSALLAKGSGGTIPPSAFATAGADIRITPPEEVSGGGDFGGSNKVTSADYDAYLAQRAAAVPQDAGQPPPGARLPPPEKV